MPTLPSRGGSSRLDRRRARASWPGKIFRDGSEAGENLLSTTTPEERLGMMWELARTSWNLTGRPWPDYQRHETPGRLIRHPS